MKNVILWFFLLSLLLCCLSGCGSDVEILSASEPTETATEEISEEATLPSIPAYQVAMITDYGDIDDMGYNQTTYEAGRDWCAENHIPYTYYKPIEDSLEARVASIEQAIREGANVLLLPGYMFGGAIVETAEKYPEVYYIALDVCAADMDEGYEVPANVFCATYREELAGFLAGYAAVKIGCRDLGFVGSIAVPAVIRYGYGFIQGADYAAGELGVQASIRYGYGLQCFCDAGIRGTQEHVDKWFRDGTEAVLFCGGSLPFCMEHIDRPYDMKIIGVDIDMKKALDQTYGEGTALTSAMKNYYATASWALSKLILEDDWNSLGGTMPTVGRVSGTDLEENHVALPDSTQWNDSFTKEDYAAIVNAICTEALSVDDSIDHAPTTKHITVEYMGNLAPSNE